MLISTYCRTFIVILSILVKGYINYLLMYSLVVLVIPGVMIHAHKCNLE
jgi:hypothetical protein